MMESYSKELGQELLTKSIGGEGVIPRTTKIGFFFDAAHLNRQWSFDTESQAVSGTDGMLLEIAKGLSDVEDFRVRLYATSLPVPEEPSVCLVESLVQAIKESQRQGDDFLVFVAISNTEQMEIFRYEQSSPLLIAWAHCTPSFQWMSAACKKRALYKMIAVSDVQRRGLEYHPLYPRMLTISNCIDLEFWQSDEVVVRDTPKVVYVGAIKPSKGFHHLADAWPMLRELNEKAELIVCGSPGLYGVHTKLGPEGIAEEEYERRCLQPLGGSRSAAMRNGVRFVGSVPKSELRRHMLNCSVVVVNPNIDGSIETFCVSAAEAMSLGVPVVGGAAGGLLEVVGDDVGGILVSDTESLTRAIAKILDDRELATRLGDNGRERAAQFFSKSTVLARWESLYRGEELSPNVLLNQNSNYVRSLVFVLMRTCFPVSMISFIRNVRRHSKTVVRGR